VDWLVGVRLWNANYISLKKTIRASVQDREREREREKGDWLVLLVNFFYSILFQLEPSVTIGLNK